jgi:flagellar protein FliS
MTTAVQLRSRYARDAVQTASPVRLVTMLYDRLARDLDDAELSISVSDHQGSHDALRHAQDIVAELSFSLNVDLWEGGVGLQRLYTWLLEQLVTANLTKDASLLPAAREMVESLREAWHEAANAQAVGS